MRRCRGGLCLPRGERDVANFQANVDAPLSNTCGPLVVKQRLPVRRHRSVRPGRWLIQRMRMRSQQLGAAEKLLGTIVVKPPLTRFETCDDRVTRRGMVLRRMLTW